MSWVLAIALAAGAQEPADPLPDPVYESLAREARSRIGSDPQAAEALARRIAQSKIAARITESESEADRLRDIREWIAQYPEYAAGLAVGLAQDEAEGTNRFEDMVTRTARRKLEENPDAHKNLFGRLKKSSRDSKLLRQAEEMSDEERREILRAFFEGRGGESDKIITQEEAAHQAASREASSGLRSNYYDRLGGANLGGYSPQLQALQSALNARRPPGAPKLIETGRLDYETLFFPAYGLRHDLQNLSRRWRYERNHALLKILGREKQAAESDILDPAREESLLKEAAGKLLPPGLSRRQTALEKAHASAQAFESAVRTARNTATITPALLAELGLKQKEAARWITVASLEEDLYWVESRRGFLSPELSAAVKACPVEEGAKAAYWKRGEGLDGRLSEFEAGARTAADLLEKSDWTRHLTRAGKILERHAAMRRHLGRDIQNFTAVPYRLLPLSKPKPRWRGWLDRLWLIARPSSAYSQRLKRTERERALLREVFVKIATGDMEAAHRMMESF